MSRNAEKTVFQIQAATESDWTWIIQGEMEIAWVRLEADRQRKVGREVVEKQVAQRVTELRKDEGFHNEAFVARAEDGVLAGFVWVAKDQNDSTGQIEALLLNQYVAKAYRGQGLGHRLMETAEEWARQQGLPRISLGVGIRNTLGQRLYESLGYRVETLRMTKQLSVGESDEFLD